VEELQRLSDLVSIARRWGRDDRFVRQAVDAGIVPKASRRGLGRGRGQRWIYPAGAGLILEVVLRLRAMGLRGNSLRFALWWIGRGEFSQSVPNFITSFFAHPIGGMWSRLSEIIKRAELVSPLLSDVESNAALDELGPADILTTELDDFLTETDLRPLQKVFRTEDTNDQLDEWQLRDVARVFPATLLGFSPAQVGGDAQFLKEFLMPPGPHSEKGARVTASGFSDTVQTPGWFGVLQGAVNSASPQSFEIAREVLRENRSLRDFIDLTRGILVDIVTGVSERERRRLGAWSKPPMAARALILGWLLFISRLAPKASQR